MNDVAITLLDIIDECSSKNEKIQETERYLNHLRDVWVEDARYNIL